MQKDRAQQCAQCGYGRKNVAWRQKTCPILCCNAHKVNVSNTKLEVLTQEMGETYEVKSALPVAALEASFESLVHHTAPLWPSRLGMS